jgi:hypothetical protein
MRVVCNSELAGLFVWTSVTLTEDCHCFPQSLQEKVQYASQYAVTGYFHTLLN